MPIKESDLFLNPLLIDKRVAFYPKLQKSPGTFSISFLFCKTCYSDQYDEVSSQMNTRAKEDLAIIKRGHLGIPEDILKAGSQQYASMCGNINNKVRIDLESKFNILIC